jgi:hypothetical protein
VCNAYVLRFVHDREIEHHVLVCRDRDGQSGEKLCVRDQIAFPQLGTKSFVDGPQYRALWLRQPGFSAETHHIAIRLPALQLPGIYDLFPFREKKMHAKLVTADGTRGVLHQFADNLATGNRRRPNVRLEEPKTDGIDRMNIDPFRETRLVAEQSP